MKCYNCNSRLPEDSDVCPKCGADVRLYRKVIYASNQYYNIGLMRAKARDLTGAAECLRISIQLYKKNINARNLLGLVYYEMGEAALALKEWVISKNFRHRGNNADRYIQDLRDNKQALDGADHSIHKYNQALEYARTGSKDMAVIQLKKVISVNPRMIKAYQLLALLYMNDNRFDEAKDVIDRCLEIDRGNPTALEYKKELELYRPSKKNNLVGVAGELEREEVIIPVRMRDYGSYLMTAGCVLLGFLLSLGVLYYIISPGLKEKYISQNEAQISEYEEKYAALNSDIADLNAQLEKLQSDSTDELDKYKNQNDEIGSKADSYEELLKTVYYFVNDDYYNASESFKELKKYSGDDETYNMVYDEAEKQIDKNITNRMFSEVLFAREQNNDRARAIELCTQILELDPAYDSAMFYSGLCSQESNDNESAVNMYKDYITKFPNGMWAAEVRGRLTQLAPDVLSAIDQALQPAAAQPEDAQEAQQPEDAQAAQQPEDAQAAQQPEDAQEVQQPADAQAAQQPEDAQAAQQPADAQAAQP